MDGGILVIGEFVGVEGVVGVDFWGEGGIWVVFFKLIFVRCCVWIYFRILLKNKNLNKLKFSFKYFKVLKLLLFYWNIKGSNFLG